MPSGVPGRIIGAPQETSAAGDATLDGMSRPLILLLAALAAPSAHATGKQIWVEPITINGAAVYFPDELIPLEDAVAEALAKPSSGGYDVIPNATVRTLWANAQRGQLPGVPVVCDYPPPPDRLTGAVYPDAGRADVHLDCKKKVCALTVNVTRPPFYVEGVTPELALLTATLPAGASPVEWAATIRKKGLKKEPPPKQRMSKLLLVRDTPPPGLYVNVEDIATSGLWSPPLTVEAFDPLRESFKACHRKATPSADWFGQPLILELDPSGKVSRCEMALPQHLPLGPESCECDALRAHAWAPTLKSRRAQLTIVFMEFSESGPDDQPLRAVDFDWSAPSDPTTKLGTAAREIARAQVCLEGLQELPAHTFKIPMKIGPDGHVRSYEATWTNDLPRKTQTCLDGVLKQVRFNCPLSGAADINASLTLEVQPPEESREEREEQAPEPGR